MPIGVLIMNTGTPDEPTLAAIKPYLTEFLMDPCIIGAPYFIRKPLVAHIVRNRPQRTLGLYQEFWTPTGSPFMLASRRQQELLQSALNSGEGSPANQFSTSESPTFHVELAMRYGNPSIAHGLEKLRDANCDTVILLPLYPQNVKVCAGTCFDEAHRQLARLGRTTRSAKQTPNPQKPWQPRVIEVPSFHHLAPYRRALARQVASRWRYERGSKLVVSFHSTLLSHIKKDPIYLEQCRQTTAWLAHDLEIPKQDVILTFQSRFDSRAWLAPFTEATVKGLVDSGVRDICVVCPGFVAENIETSLEISRDLRNQVEQKPVIGHVAHNRLHVMQDACAHASFTYVPALGDAPGLIDALAQAVRQTLL